MHPTAAAVASPNWPSGNHLSFEQTRKHQSPLGESSIYPLNLPTRFREDPQLLGIFGDDFGMRLVLHAPNVHQGGGASLLTALVQAEMRGMQRHLVVDQRFLIPASIAPDVSIERVPPTLAGRLRAEWELRSLATPSDVVLCLGNLPPIFRLAARTTLFLQNRHLVESLPKGFPLKVKLRNVAEKVWLRSRLANVENIIVQTPTMQELVRGVLDMTSDVLPFIGDQEVLRPALPREPSFDFIYVSSGEPHKNHLMLLAAWRLLAQENIRPHLAITLSEDRDRELCRAISSACGTYALNITNLGVIPLDTLPDLYSTATAFVFPSLGESFGLPMLEAAAAGLPIIAPEADYVRDVVDPVETFDPTSPLSIARAIKRFLHLPEARTALASPEQFMTAVISGDFPNKCTLSRYKPSSLGS